LGSGKASANLRGNCDGLGVIAGKFGRNETCFSPVDSRKDQGDSTTQT
jgi:hypothetical protein